jgi:hypothetical protein
MLLTHRWQLQNLSATAQCDMISGSRLMKDDWRRHGTFFKLEARDWKVENLKISNIKSMLYFERQSWSVDAMGWTFLWQCSLYVTVDTFIQTALPQERPSHYIHISALALKIRHHPLSYLYYTSSQFRLTISEPSLHYPKQSHQDSYHRQKDLKN